MAGVFHSNRGVERTPKNYPAAPARIQTRNLLIMSPVLYQHAILAPYYLLNKTGSDEARTFKPGFCPQCHRHSCGMWMVWESLHGASNQQNCADIICWTVSAAILNKNLLFYSPWLIFHIHIHTMEFLIQPWCNPLWLTGFKSTNK